jgi:hypothetical protein
MPKNQLKSRAMMALDGFDIRSAACRRGRPGGVPAQAASDFIGYFISKSYNVLTFRRETRTCKKKAEKPTDGGHRTAMSVPPLHLEYFIENR